MPQLLEIIMSSAKLIVVVLQALMFIRAVLSWLPLGDDNPIESFVYTVTEPFIMPIRALFEYFGWGENLPIDIPCLVTIVILTVFEMLISIY